MPADPDLKILVVSPDAEKAKLILALLKKIGYQHFSYAPNNKGAVKTLASGHDGLVFMDCPNGAASALSLLKPLRTSPKYQTLPFVALFHSPDGIEGPGLDSDPSARVVRPPFKPEDVQAVIEGLLRGDEAEEVSLSDISDEYPTAFKAATLLAGKREYSQACAYFKALRDKFGEHSEIIMGQALCLMSRQDHAGVKTLLQEAVQHLGSASPAQDKGKHGMWGDISEEDRHHKAFELYNDEHEGREAYRHYIGEWWVHIRELDQNLTAIDLSSTGVGMESPRPTPKPASIFHMDLIHENKTELENLPIKVMGTDPNVTGCKFHELDRHQEEHLDKLLITIQKSQAGKMAGKPKKVIKLGF